MSADKSIESSSETVAYAESVEDLQELVTQCEFYARDVVAARFYTERQKTQLSAVLQAAGATLGKFLDAAQLTRH